MASPPTLRSKLLRWLLLPLTLLLLVDIAGSYFVVQAITRDIYDGELAEIARELVLHVRPDGAAFAFDLSPDAERTLLLDEYDKVYYAIRDGDGRTIAGQSALPAIAPSGRSVTFGDALFDGTSVRIAALQVPLSNSAAATVQVAETRLKRTLLSRELLLGIALPQVVLILLAGVLAWVGVTHGLAPLERMRGAVAARSHVDMSPLDARDVPGEVHPLVTAINDLMSRLGAVLDYQARFIADTAHQLRTPVAGLKAHIEVALRETDLAQTKAALAHLYTSSERLSHLVSQLLSLARNEPNTAKAHFALFDFNKLALETTAEWVAEAYRKSIDLGFESAEQPVTVYGDPARLRELINNLVDNAIRYTPPGGRVTVQVRLRHGPQLVVSDDGPRIPPEERERVFERFHRLLGTHVEGSGLGLAIVREIAALHKAEISLDDDVDGVGNTFMVTFPPPEDSVPGASTLHRGNVAESHV
jgi:two-component system sensor histidine kinase TctE